MNCYDSKGSIDDMQIFTLASFFRAGGLPAMKIGGKSAGVRGVTNVSSGILSIPTDV